MKKITFILLLIYISLIKYQYASVNLTEFFFAQGWHCFYKPGLHNCEYSINSPFESGSYNDLGEKDCLSHFPQLPEPQLVIGSPPRSICLPGDSQLAQDICEGTQTTTCCCYMTKIKNLICTDGEQQNLNPRHYGIREAALGKYPDIGQPSYDPNPCVDIQCNNKLLHEVVATPINNCCSPKPYPDGDGISYTNGTEDCKNDLECLELRGCDANANQCIYQKKDIIGCCEDVNDCPVLTCKNSTACTNGKCEYEPIDEDCCEKNEDCPQFYYQTFNGCINNKCEYTLKPYCCETDENCKDITGYKQHCLMDSILGYKTCQPQPIPYCLATDDCPSDPCSDYSCLNHVCTYEELPGCRYVVYDLEATRSNDPNECCGTAPCSDTLTWTENDKLPEIENCTIKYYNGEDLIELETVPCSDKEAIIDFPMCDNAPHLYVIYGLNKNETEVGYPIEIISY